MAPRPLDALVYEAQYAYFGHGASHTRVVDLSVAHSGVRAELRREQGGGSLLGKSRMPVPALDVSLNSFCSVVYVSAESSSADNDGLSPLAGFFVLKTAHADTALEVYWVRLYSAADEDPASRAAGASFATSLSDLSPQPTELDAVASLTPFLIHQLDAATAQSGGTLAPLLTIRSYARILPRPYLGLRVIGGELALEVALVTEKKLCHTLSFTVERLINGDTDLEDAEINLEGTREHGDVVLCDFVGPRLAVVACADGYLSTMTWPEGEKAPQEAELIPPPTITHRRFFQRATPVSSSRTVALSHLTVETTNGPRNYTFSISRDRKVNLWDLSSVQTVYRTDMSELASSLGASDAFEMPLVGNEEDTAVLADTVVPYVKTYRLTNAAPWLLVIFIPPVIRHKASGLDVPGPTPVPSTYERTAPQFVIYRIHTDANTGAFEQLSQIAIRTLSVDEDWRQKQLVDFDLSGIASDLENRQARTFRLTALWNNLGRAESSFTELPEVDEVATSLVSASADSLGDLLSLHTGPDPGSSGDIIPPHVASHTVSTWHDIDLNRLSSDEWADPAYFADLISARSYDLALAERRGEELNSEDQLQLAAGVFIRQLTYPGRYSPAILELALQRLEGDTSLDNHLGLAHPPQSIAERLAATVGAATAAEYYAALSENVDDDEDDARIDALAGLIQDYSTQWFSFAVVCNELREYSLAPIGLSNSLSGMSNGTFLVLNDGIAFLNVKDVLGRMEYLLEQNSSVQELKDFGASGIEGDGVDISPVFSILSRLNRDMPLFQKKALASNLGSYPEMLQAAHTIDRENRDNSVFMTDDASLGRESSDEIRSESWLSPKQLREVLAMLYTKVYLPALLEAGEDDIEEDAGPRGEAIFEGLFSAGETETDLSNGPQTPTEFSNGPRMMAELGAILESTARILSSPETLGQTASDADTEAFFHPRNTILVPSQALTQAWATVVPGQLEHRLDYAIHFLILLYFVYRGSDSLDVPESLLDNLMLSMHATVHSVASLLQLAEEPALVGASLSIAIPNSNASLGKTISNTKASVEGGMANSSHRAIAFPDDDNLRAFPDNPSSTASAVSLDALSLLHLVVSKNDTYGAFKNVYNQPHSLFSTLVFYSTSVMKQLNIVKPKVKLYASVDDLLLSRAIYNLSRESSSGSDSAVPFEAPTRKQIAANRDGKITHPEYLAFVRRFVENYPRSYGASYLLGRVALDLNQYEDAKTHFDHCIEGVTKDLLPPSRFGADSEDGIKGLKEIVPDPASASAREFLYHLVQLYLGHERHGIKDLNALASQHLFSAPSHFKKPTVPTAVYRAILYLSRNIIRTQTGEHLDTLKMEEIYHQHFRSNIELEDFDEAFGALKDMPLHSEIQKRCMIHLITQLCENAMAPRLYGYAWQELRGAFEANLEFRARNCDVRDRVPDYYKILYGYYVSQKKYEMACATMVHKGRRLGDFLGRNGGDNLHQLRLDSYLVALNVIELCRGEEEAEPIVTLTVPGPSPPRGVLLPRRAAEPTALRVELATPVSLREEFALVQTQVALWRKDPTTTPIVTRETAVSLLMRAGLVDKALEMGALFEQDLTAVFRSLTQHVIALAVRAIPGIHLDINPGLNHALVSQKVRCGNPVLSGWRRIEELLSVYDTPLHVCRKAVLEEYLSVKSTDLTLRLEQSGTQDFARIPPFLVRFFQEKDPSYLLRTLIETGRLGAAFNVASDLVSSEIERREEFDADHDWPNTTYLPFSVLEQLLVVDDDPVDPENTSLELRKKGLRVALERLKDVTANVEEKAFKKRKVVT